MSNLTLLVEPKIQFFGNNGQPLAGGKIYTYDAGTTTPRPTYTTSTGDVANANPVILDSTGRASIFLNGIYKVVVKDSADATIYTQDNISDVASMITASTDWTVSGLAPTYISATSFSVVGDQTAYFHAPRRVRVSCTAGVLYGTITAASFAAGLTTVTVVMDSGSLDSGLSIVDYGFVNYANPAIRKMPIINHGVKGGNFTLEMALADVHVIEFSQNATLTITSALTADKGTIIVKNGNHTITLAGIDNNSPTLTVGASKQDFITLAKSFGKISCIAYALDFATT